MKCSIIKEFQSKVLQYYLYHKRNFPWRYTFNPYKVLVSEILLQQTNVEKVIKPYCAIIEKYCSIQELGNAEIEFLRDLFKDLGLFYRADRLINISKQIIEKYGGIIPEKREDLIKIKGIGDYTCNAVLCFGYKKPYAIVDTNVIRVFERVLNFKSLKKRPHTDKKIWEFAQLLLPFDDFIDYNYGLLDFAALVCKARKPSCSECLMSSICYYKNIGIEM